MGPVEALELALSKEKQSIELYQKFSVKFPVAKDVFLFLLGEEQKHKKLIETEISKLVNQ